MANQALFAVHAQADQGLVERYANNDDYEEISITIGG